MAVIIKLINENPKAADNIANISSFLNKISDKGLFIFMFFLGFGIFKMLIQINLKSELFQQSNKLQDIYVQ